MKKNTRGKFQRNNPTPTNSTTKPRSSLGLVRLIVISLFMIIFLFLFNQANSTINSVVAATQTQTPTPLPEIAKQPQNVNTSSQIYFPLVSAFDEVQQIPGDDWPMLAGNPQRTSWNTEEVRGNLAVEWYVTINAKIVQDNQVIAADNKIFVATTKGLFAFNASSGAFLWVYGTEMPLGNVPTYANGVLYVGGYDRRIHAINAADGKLKAGWNFVEAGAGFETNPLVINNRVYIGNRDGYFYCLDGSTGNLIWKWRDESDENPDAPIRFSAAYKNGVIYYGQDNSHAYAIRDNGQNASLVWKSAKLPGVGFASYWPVIYHDKTSNKDYVLFSGSKKDVSFGWFSSPALSTVNFYFGENYQLFSNIPLGGLIGPLGNVSGDWAPGTVTIDASKIQNYFNANPQKRHLLILDRTTGAEYTPYAPVSWVSVTHGGNKQPPVIGSDGVIYTHIGYKNGDVGLSPNMGASGGVSGWKFGTPYISRVYDFSRGYADETVNFTAGGNLIYWTEGFNMPYGAFDITQPFGTNASWEYTYCAGCLGYPSNKDVGTFTPYKQKLYMMDGNKLVALSKAGGLKDLGTVNPTAPTTPPSNVITKQALKDRLEAEVAKMINAGPLRPGFHDSGIWGAAASGYYPGDLVVGDHLAEYFHTPGDTIYTLYYAYPYLTPGLQSQVINYLKNYYGIGKINDITKYANIGWKNGAPREIFTDTPEMNAVIQNPNDDVNSVVASVPRTYFHYLTQLGQFKIWNFPQDSFYGAWKYAQLIPSEAKSLFDAMKSKLETPILSDSELNRYPYILNQYIAGYRGYLELEKMSGYTTNITASTKYAEYNRLLNLRINNFTPSISFSGFTYNNSLKVVQNFMFMVPELADEFRARILPSIQTTVTDYSTTKPYWFVTKYDRTYGEGRFEPLYIYQSIFQARALILQETSAQLVKYVDVPAFWRGDLYYIQDLAAAIAAN